ncbi:MAG: hypothetical protein BWY32_02799 [bacterium ADurb.Bin243]|nr:MAG: hypothetical protein BWY32_02799 [bacterium ADurb.Bin243]HOD41822.1 DUF6448 family protein [Candidatus Wallbacteria bacterium]
MKKSINYATIFLLTGALVLLLNGLALAHCDTLNGPVVKAAERALETKDINRVLLWVQKKDEAEIKKAFEKTLAVRKLDPKAKDLADMYFYETLVRIHRAGEGAPYTGLKPAETDLGPAIPAADKALEKGKIEPVAKLLTDAVNEGLHENFKHAIEKKKFDKDNVEAGREFVEAYVKYVHFVEGVYEASKKSEHGHGEGETKETEKHDCKSCTK